MAAETHSMNTNRG